MEVAMIEAVLNPMKGRICHMVYVADVVETVRIEERDLRTTEWWVNTKNLDDCTLGIQNAM
jgi:hypothetical protein